MPNIRHVILIKRLIAGVAGVFVKSFVRDVVTFVFEKNLDTCHPARQNRKMLVDGFACQVSPPDRHGYCSLGTSVDCTRAALQCATTVIGQVNK